MHISAKLRAVFFGVALAGIGLSSAANAATCSISFSVLKAGWFIGGSGGNGVVVCGGKRYPIGIGGVSGGLVFGASETRFRGTVSNIRQPSDVAGVYAAAGVGGAAIVGGQALALRNEKGAVLRVTGRQVGLQVNLDVSGLAISMR